MNPPLISAVCIGILFGVLAESFAGTHERINHIFVGLILAVSLLAAAFFVQSVPFYGWALPAVILLVAGCGVGWNLSKLLNARWEKGIDNSQ